MLHRCSSYQRKFRSFVGLPPSRCTGCGGLLVPTSSNEDPGPMPRTQQRAKDPTEESGMVELMKGLGSIWGIGGGVNLIARYIEREPIRPQDLFHAAFPWMAVGVLASPRTKRQLILPPQPGCKPHAETVQTGRDVIRRIQEEPGSESQHDIQRKLVEKLRSTAEDLRQFMRERKTQTADLKKLTIQALGVPEVPEDPRAHRWRGILSPYPRILILGGQGTGKSCLAFWLLEILHTQCPCFVYGLPREGVSRIPPWLGIIHELKDAPPRSVVLIDEAYLVLFSRESQSRQNREITRLLNLTRQKRLGLIFVAHEARHIDKNVLSSIDTLVIKELAPLQVELDRTFLRPYLLKAQSHICLRKSGRKRKAGQRTQQRREKEKGKGAPRQVRPLLRGDCEGARYGKDNNLPLAHGGWNERIGSPRISSNGERGTLPSFHYGLLGTEVERLRNGC